MHRLSLGFFAAACLFISTNAPSLADAWPSRSIKLIVPFPAGGAADPVARVYADKLSVALKQPIVIENKPGAGTAIAADAAAKADPDGYTLSLAPAGQLTILPHLNKSIAYDPFKSFSPVSLLASVPYVVASSPNTPISDVKQLLAAAKKEPAKLTYSSCGPGTLCHLSGEYFKSLTGTDFLHVPFKGSAPAMNALLGDQINLSFDTLTVLSPQIRDGKVKGLVITSRERSQLLPDVPTAAEAGLPDFVVRFLVRARRPRGDTARYCRAAERRNQPHRQSAGSARAPCCARSNRRDHDTRRLHRDHPRRFRSMG